MPEIEFLDSGGQRIEFHSCIVASWNPWPAGSSVQVFYAPQDPTNAETQGHPRSGAICDRRFLSSYRWFSEKAIRSSVAFGRPYRGSAVSLPSQFSPGTRLRR
jgi:hypothetical protein